MDFTASGSHEACRVAGGANHQITRRVKRQTVFLLVRHVDFRFDWLIDSQLPYVGSNPNDRYPGHVLVRITKLEAFTNRLFARPVLTRHSFIDNGNMNGLFVVALFQRASFSNRNADGLEVVETDLAMIRVIGKTAGAGLAS